MHGILNLESLKNKISSFVKENCLDGVLISDSEGFPIVFYSLFYVDEDKLSADLSSFFSFIDINDERPLFFKFNRGYVVASPLGSEYRIVIFAPESVKLNRSLVLLRDLKLNLQQLIDG